jgi:DNA-binding NarL/FixJ family response regulator
MTETIGITLSRRELEVITLIAEGCPDAGIGAALGISPSTAHFHAFNAVRKLGKPNRASAVAEAVRRGIIA